MLNYPATPTVVTFDPHPQEFFTRQCRTLLTPLAEKVQQLAQLGVEQLVLLPFNHELACLSPRAFVQEILVQKLAARSISVGFNFRFGHRRAGTAEDLQAIAADYGVGVSIVAPQICAGERISSSAIRAALEVGDLALANRLLGRPYSLLGCVVSGQQLGRTLGFPTANLQVPTEKFLPRSGVYSVRVTGPEFAEAQIGVLNLGCRPTLGGDCQTIEVHLLDWSGDLYGQTLKVSLEQFLRPEQKFTSLEALKTQIQADCVATRALFQAPV